MKIRNLLVFASLAILVGCGGGETTTTISSSYDDTMTTSTTVSDSMTTGEEPTSIADEPSTITSEEPSSISVEEPSSITVDEPSSSTEDDTSSSFEEKTVYRYDVDFTAKRTDAFNYNNGNNQAYFLTDYFREDEADIIKEAATTNTYCDLGFVKLGSASGFGSMTLTIDEKYEAVKVIVHAKGYSKYIEYNGSWSNDNSTLGIDGQKYPMEYVAGGAQKSADCLREYSPYASSIFVESTGKVGYRVLLISMEIYYVFSS